MQNDEIKTYTFNPTKKTGIYKLMIFLEIGVTCLLLFLGYTFLYKLQTPTSSKISEASFISPGPTAIPTKVKIPHSYEITAIGNNEMILRGDTGELTLPLGPEILIFKGTSEAHTAATAADLKVGEQVMLEIIPGEKAWVYIL
jgi:hypothetical protein